MTTSYLIVTKWRGVDAINSLDATTWALVKRVSAQGKKARKFAHAYAIKLNDGVDYSHATGLTNLMQALRENLEYFTVCAIPDSQAREYNNYLEWEDCDTFER